jgi:hypothetical protein
MPSPSLHQSPILVREGPGSVRSIRRHAPRFAIRSTDGLYLEKSFLVIGACP